MISGFDFVLAGLAAVAAGRAQVVALARADAGAVDLAGT